MALHTHSIVLGDEVVELEASDGNPHTHVGTVSDGGTLTTTDSDETPGHVHRVSVGDTAYATSGPILVVPIAQNGGSRTGDTVNVHVSKVPYVLTYEAVRDNVMPEVGESGIPASLARTIPPEYRYWRCAKAEDAAAVRLALVESGLVTETTVHEVEVEVDGQVVTEIVRVEVQQSAEEIVPDYGDEPETFPVVPAPETSLEKAARLCDLDANAHVVSAETLEFVGIEVVLAKCSTSARDWVIQVPVATLAHEALSKRADACCVFLLKECDQYAYYGSGIPEEDAVRWCWDPSADHAAVLRIRQTLTSNEIAAAVDDLSLPQPYLYLSESVAAVMAKRGEQWTRHDHRVAARAISYLDREFAKDASSRNVELMKALGVDVQKATSLVLQKVDRINLRKFADATPQINDERLVYGVVMEPPPPGQLVGDLHGDACGRDVIQRAYYGYVENSQTIGLQHNEVANGRARITQMFLAPCDFVPPGCDESEVILEGSWVMEYRIVCDDLWKSIKAGEFTGFSIGGTAYRVPVSPTVAL